MAFIFTLGIAIRPPKIVFLQSILEHHSSLTQAEHYINSLALEKKEDVLTIMNVLWTAKETRKKSFAIPFYINNRLYTLHISTKFQCFCHKY